MKIIIIDHRDDRGIALQKQILNFEAPDVTSVEYFEEIVLANADFPDDAAIIKKSDLVPVTNDSLLLMHGRNTHCGWYVQQCNKSHSIPIVIYTGGSSYAKVKGNHLEIDGKQFKLSKPGNVLAVPQPIQNAESLNLKKAIPFLLEHLREYQEFFSLVLGRSKKISLSLQLIHYCLTPDSISKTVLHKGKLTDRFKPAEWLPEESVGLIETKINGLAKKKDSSGSEYATALNELKTLLLPELYK